MARLPDVICPLPISDELTAGVGRVVIHFAYLESFVDKLTGQLIGASPSLFQFVAQDVSNASKLGWIRQLLKQMFVGQVGHAHMIEMLDRIDDARRQRNSLMHGLWREGSEGNVALVQTIRTDRAIPIQHEVITVADLADLLKDILTLTCELEAFCSTLAELGIPEKIANA